MNCPHAHHFVYSLPPEGAECRGSEPASAGLDGTKSRRVSRRRDLQGQASLGAARREA
jgi:hypothetical protein